MPQAPQTGGKPPQPANPRPWAIHARSAAVVMPLLPSTTRGLVHVLAPGHCARREVPQQRCDVRSLWLVSLFRLTNRRWVSISLPVGQEAMIIVTFNVQCPAGCVGTLLTGVVMVAP